MTDLTTDHCTACKKANALWMLQVGRDLYAAHKPCAERIKVQAPTGVVVKITPSATLRAKWEAERRERDARAFWTEKFQKARATSGGQKSATSFSPRNGSWTEKDSTGDYIMIILNLTQHAATPDQIAAGVREPAGGEGGKAEVQELLTFDDLPDTAWILAKAEALATVARAHAVDAAMIGGAPYLMGPLEAALKEQGIKPLHAFTRRESSEVPDGAGGVRKTQVFRHVAFIDV